MGLHNQGQLTVISKSMKLNFIVTGQRLITSVKNILSYILSYIVSYTFSKPNISYITSSIEVSPLSINVLNPGLCIGF